MTIRTDTLLLVMGLFAQPGFCQSKESEAPLQGAFYSLQFPDNPPLPGSPFPELPIYARPEGGYVFDDRSVDYAKLQSAASATESGLSGFALLSVSGLKLTNPLLTNGYIYTSIFDHDPALVYDVYTKTNLTSTNWVFGTWGIVGQTNYSLSQSSYPWNVFLMAASGLDSDGDGLPDNWEAAYGLNPNSAADANQDSDGDGLTNWQEFQQGTNPANAPSFQVLITSPRSILP